MLLRRELRQNLKAFLITTGICCALSAYMVALIPTMGSEMQSIIDMKMPKQMQLAFGMQGLDLSRPIGTYSIMFSYLYLTFGIYAASLFGNIVAKEFADKTVEFLFSLPARRGDILRTKLLVGVGYLSASVLVTMLVTSLSFALLVKDDVEWGSLYMMGLAYWLGAMCFGAVAFWLSARYVKGRIAVGLVLGAYILQVVISLKDALEFMKFVSPFDWFKGNAIVSAGGLDVVNVGICVCIAALAGVMGWRAFVRKEVLV